MTLADQDAFQEDWFHAPDGKYQRPDVREYRIETEGSFYYAKSGGNNSQFADRVTIDDEDEAYYFD